MLTVKKNSETLEWNVLYVRDGEPKTYRAIAYLQPKH